MHIDSLLSSFLAFAAAVVLLELTRGNRSSSKGLNFILIAIALLLSLFLSAYTSRDPKASGSHMFYLWVAYAIFSSFIRKKKPATGAEKRANDDPVI